MRATLWIITNQNKFVAVKNINFKVWYNNDMQAGEAYEVCESADSASCSASVTDSESISSANHLQYFNVSIYSWFRSGCASKLHLKLRPHLPFFQHYQYQHQPSKSLYNLPSLHSSNIFPLSVKPAPFSLSMITPLNSQESQLMNNNFLLKPLMSFNDDKLKKMTKYKK